MNDGPVFRHAAGCLPVVRAADPTRLVLLSSGRWDAQPGIGSVCNPGSREWVHVWGIEPPGAPPSPTKSPDMDLVPLGYFQSADHAHTYPEFPQCPAAEELIRRLGREAKPVFLSEYGIGSLMDVVRQWRGFRQAGARPDLEDAAMLRVQSEKLEADWKRWGFTGVYPFAEDMLRDSQRLHARQRSHLFDLVRANPRFCGYNLTGMLDHGMTGEGLWTFWREWKGGCRTDHPDRAGQVVHVRPGQVHEAQLAEGRADDPRADRGAASTLSVERQKKGLDAQADWFWGGIANALGWYYLTDAHLVRDDVPAFLRSYALRRKHYDHGRRLFVVLGSMHPYYVPRCARPHVRLHACPGRKPGPAG